MAVVPSGELVERKRIYAPGKIWTTKASFRIQVHIKFVNW